jgi:cytochrome b561
MDRAFFREMLGLHELAANTLGVVALGHAAAALFHHWALRDRTLARMLPGLG